MMHILEDFSIKCDSCGHITLVEADSLDCETYIYDRPMGDEVEYNFRGEFCCEECRSWISLSICGYEYPIGAFNYSSSECSGGELLSDPQIQIVYEFDFRVKIIHQHIAEHLGRHFRPTLGGVKFGIAVTPTVVFVLCT